MIVETKPWILPMIFQKPHLKNKLKNSIEIFRLTFSCVWVHKSVRFLWILQVSRQGGNDFRYNNWTVVLNFQ